MPECQGLAIKQIKSESLFARIGKSAKASVKGSVDNQKMNVVLLRDISSLVENKADFVF